MTIDGGGKQIRPDGDSARSESLGYGMTLRNVITRPVLERHFRHELPASFLGRSTTDFTGWWRATTEPRRK